MKVRSIILLSILGSLFLCDVNKSSKAKNIQLVSGLLLNTFKHKFEQAVDHAGGHTQCAKDLKALLKNFVLFRKWAIENTQENVLMCFSVCSNGKKLFSFVESPGKINHYLDCLSGLKWKYTLPGVISGAAVLAVDMFFSFSGLLLSYGYLKYRSTVANVTNTNLIALQLYRILRLWPALIAMIMFTIGVLKHLGDGPFWTLLMAKVAGSCFKYGWANIFFVNNYLDPNQQCLEQTWYLAVDSQLFLLSPILLIALSKAPLKTCFACIGACLVSGLYAFIITYQNNYAALYHEGNKVYQQYIYLSTFVRMPSWLIGFVTGVIIFYYRNVKLQQVTVLFAWIASISTLTYLVMLHLTFLTNDYDPIKAAMFNSAARPAWSIAICLIVFLCSSGHGGLINEFLSTKLFQVLVRMSYSVYLVHMIVIIYFVGIRKHAEQFSNLKIFLQLLSDLFFTFIAATICCLAFESPFIQAAKLIFKKEYANKSDNAIVKKIFFDDNDVDPKSVIDLFMGYAKRYNDTLALKLARFAPKVLQLYEDLKNPKSSFPRNKCFKVLATWFQRLKAWDNWALANKNFSMLVAFSIYTNWKKIFSTKKTENNLTCLNGLRVVSMMWIILGHLYGIVVMMPKANFLDFIKAHESIEAAFPMAANLAVDTFFVVGGLLVSYVFLTLEDKKININFFWFYLHRIMRLTPSLLALIIFCVTIMDRIAYGPFWTLAVYKIKNTCIKNWWSTLLYVQNYVNPTNMCLSHSWYIAVDMQYCIITPPLLILMRRTPKFTMFIAGTIIVLSCLAFFLITWFLKIGPSAVGVTDLVLKYVYVTAHTRASSWMIGFLFGYVLYSYKSKPLKLSQFTKWCAWAVLMGSMAGLVIYHKRFLNQGPWPLLETSLFNTLTRPTWSIALCGVIFLCVTGYGDAVNSLLSKPIFTILIRLNYNVYLTHVIALVSTYGSFKAPYFGEAYRVVIYDEIKYGNKKNPFPIFFCW
nr:unnamed protein product [Callosobruchus chinensis]